jgi:hypothetical protein
LAAVVAGFTLRGQLPEPVKPLKTGKIRANFAEPRLVRWILHRARHFSDPATPTIGYVAISRRLAAKGILMSPRAISRLVKTRDPELFQARKEALGRRRRPHWISAARRRILAGEDELEVLAEFGYFKSLPTPLPR